MSENNMVFTIAIPTYNNADCVEKAINSALNQKFSKEFEILVVNNSSTDNTLEVLQKYDRKIKIINNDSTVSMYQNHNICLKEAKGNYIIFCHSDDQLLPNALDTYYSILVNRNFPSNYVLWGRSMISDYYLVWKKSGYNLNQIASGIRAMDVFINGGGISPSGTLFSKESFFNIGGFVNTTHYLAPSDWITSFKLALNYFEFEMSERIFFKREFASTNKVVKYQDKLDAIEEAFLNLLLEMEDSSILIDYLKTSKLFKLEFMTVLRSTKTLSAWNIRVKLMRYLLKKPQHIFINIGYLKLLF